VPIGAGFEISAYFVTSGVQSMHTAKDALPNEALRNWAGFKPGHRVSRDWHSALSPWNIWSFTIHGPIQGGVEIRFHRYCQSPVEARSPFLFASLVADEVGWTGVAGHSGSGFLRRHRLYRNAHQH